MRRGVTRLFTVRSETLFLFSPLRPLFLDVYCVSLLGLDLDPDLDTARAQDLDKDDDCSPGPIGIQVRLTAAADACARWGVMTPAGPWVCQRPTPFLFTSPRHCSSLLYFIHTDFYPEDDEKLKINDPPDLDTAPASLKLTEGLDDPMMSASSTLPR